MFRFVRKQVRTQIRLLRVLFKTTLRCFILLWTFRFLDNVKALYRRARAHAGAWNPTDAKSDFERVAHLDKSLAATCCKEIKRIEEMEKQKNFDDREKFKALFKAWRPNYFLCMR